MLNNEAKLLNDALCIVCPQRQASLIVCHDMANMLAQREGLSVRRRQIVSAAAILHITYGQMGMEMARLLEECSYVPSFRRAILELVYSIGEDIEAREAAVLHDALLLAECILYPAQDALFIDKIISANANRILSKYVHFQNS